MSSNGLSLSVALADFINYMKFRKGASKTTLDTYQYVLLDFIDVVGNIDTSELTVTVVDQYATARSLRPIKPKTYRNKLVIIRCLINYLYKYDKCLLRPDLIELPKDQHTEANFLDEAETKRLVRSIDNVRDRAMILTLLTSGLRVSELTDLRVPDVYKRSVAVRSGKGGKPRITFITKETRLAIDLYLNGRTEGYLFCNPQGNHMSRVIVARKVSCYAAKAGIKKTVTAHTLRHTFATTMLKRGARVEDVQKLLGHANIKTTLIYLHFTNYDLEKSYNKAMLA